MNYTILGNEIAQPAYAGMTDAEIVAALNAPGASTRRRVPIAELQARATGIGWDVKFIDAAGDSDGADGAADVALTETKATA